ncbi:hypothetical protein Mapa_000179 [Marchantia paleacea]|nr:hypothetical protein Mapa_000179 [Marchantia paleacea]
MPTSTLEIDLDVPAPSFWAAMKDQNSIFPKISPEVIASIETVEGEAGQPGSVRKVTFGPAVPSGSFMTEKLVSVDVDNFTISSEEVEGGHLAQGFTKYGHKMKVVSVGDKSKLIVNSEYEGGSDAVLNESKNGMTKAFKALEGHCKSTSV